MNEFASYIVPDQLFGGFFALSIVLGAVFGSFVNAASWRIPNGIAISDGRSVCPSCWAPLRWYHNIPIVSFLALRGQCGHCGAKISIRYLWVEVAAALSFGFHAHLYMPLGQVVWASVLVLILLLLTVIDLETMTLPDIVTLPSAVMFLAAAYFEIGPVDWFDAFYGAAFGFGGLWTIRMLYLLIRGIDGMGQGDIKFMLLIGAVVGLQGLAICLLIASISALAIAGVGTLVSGGDRFSRFPFGPYLALGCMVTVWLRALELLP